MDSKARGGGIRLFLFMSLCSLLIGGAFFCFENFGVLSLKGYSLEAPNSDIENRFWSLIPSDCLRFWPLFMVRFSQLHLLVERTIPVNVSTEAPLGGGGKTKISFVEPWLRVEWRGRLWFLSKDGLMWEPSLLGLKPPAGAIWKLPDILSRYSQVGTVDVVPEGVFPALFSTQMLKGFVEIFDGQTWFRSVNEVRIEKRAGEYLIRLFFDTGGQKFSVLAQGESGKWRNIMTVLPRVLPQMRKGVQEFVVDMTYSNKVVVTQDVREGSSK